ncbi:MAG TPA: DUF1576 domain-containing protein [Candidatus Cloacimonadota bacterium]|nr:DUF1576 domain-containing protein [Candidatus Cloacimonadota bacterium]
MRIKNYLSGKIVVPFVFIFLFTLSLFLDKPMNTLIGYFNILTSSGLLISDYLHIGGLSASLFNVASLLLVYFSLINHLQIKVTGPIFAGLFTIAGFAFFGKNLVNTLPLLSGIYLYSLYHKIDIRNVMIIILFSTGISPLVSFTMFDSGINLIYSIPLGIFLGVFTGFILPPFVAHTVKFHSGYDLYNIGFAMGILALIYTAGFKAFGIIVSPVNLISVDYHWILFSVLLLFSASFIIIAYMIDNSVHTAYTLILEKSGRLVTDFIREAGLAPALLNIGLMGFLSLIIVLVLNIKISGPVIGGILTVMGFSAFGKHPKNSVPVMLGVTAAAFLSHYTLNSASVVIAIFFGTALAPISGKYGPVIGFFAGFVHFFVVQATSPFQGGFDLYNNGFAAGFVAAVFVPILESFRKEEE